MKILIIDRDGSALDFAMRAMAHGHQVKMFVSKYDDGTPNCVGTGFVERIKDWMPWMRWADMTMLTDNTKYLHMLEPFRKLGYPIVGGNPVSAELELDRQKGQQVFQKSGIEILPCKTFTDYDTAEAYVRRTQERYVSKPSDDADKALSYVAKSPRDMIFMLRRWKKLRKLKTPFILQLFMPGVEMAVGGWFGPNGFSKMFCENWEFKKLMNDDLGVATGEQGTILRYTSTSKLAEKVLKPCAEALHKTGYVGYVDVNCIVSEAGTPFPLEWTMRFGWPTFHIQQALHRGDPATFLADLCDGRDTFEPGTDIAAGVVVSMPDYPYSKITKKEVTGVPIYDVTDRNRDHLHFAEVMQGSAPDDKGVDQLTPVSCGDYLLVATGTGLRVGSAVRAAYKTVNSLEVPNSIMYRTDIGQRLKKQLPLLHKAGFATGVEF